MALTNGSGAQSAPYLISTAAELNDIRNYSGSYFKLTNDIDLSAGGISNWVPIPSGWAGNIDGGNWSITNFNCTLTNGHAGFIAVASNATVPTVIKNLSIIGGSTGVVTSSTFYCAYLVAVQSTNNPSVQIQDVYVQGILDTGGDRGSGIVGIIQSNNVTITRCIANVTMPQVGRGSKIAFVFDGVANITNCFMSSAGTGVAGDSSPGTFIPDDHSTTTQAFYTDFDFVGTWALDDGIPKLIKYTFSGEVVLSGIMPKLTGRFLATPASLKQDLQIIDGSFLANSVSFSQDLARLSGNLYSNQIEFKFDLAKLEASFFANRPILNKDLAKLTGGFLATPASLKKDLISLTGNFYPDRYRAYLSVNLAKLTGTFTHSSAGYVVITKPIIASRRYRAKITNNGDYSFPISSINGTIRATGGTISVVCPDALNYAAEIIQKNNGLGTTMTIYSDEIYSDGTIKTDVKVFNSLDISYARGARNYSIIISGKIDLTIPTTPRRFQLEGIQYQTLQSNGGIRVRADLNKDILPGDYCVIFGGAEIIAGQVQYIIGANTKSMEIAELI